MSLSPSTRIGPYEVVAALGAGGMGEVYRAVDTKLKRQVALKVLPSALSADPDRLARFQREAEVLALLNHPNIAHIYGLEGQEGPDGRERQEGLRAIVMELVEGPTLADRIAISPIPVAESLSIAAQVAEAIEAAHEQGIVHRDLKPANIKVRDDGTVKVLDFGLAKALDSTVAANPNVTNSPTLTMQAAMTGAGMILGTAAYMSPEQARGRVADKRSDIWAFGCVLFEMLTGKRAFSGEEVTDIIAAIVRDEPDWGALPDVVPDNIRLLLRRCLEKDWKKRISEIGTARFLIAEPTAASALPSAGVAGVPQRSFSRRPMPYVLASIALAATVATTVWATRPTVTPAPVVRFTAPLGEGQIFTNIGRHETAISPDGKRMVYVANYQLYLRDLSSLEATPIAGTKLSADGTTVGVTSPAFSPDGQSIAFYSGSDRTLKRLAITGGAASTICNAENPFGVSWTDDSILFGLANKGIWRVSQKGGTPEIVVNVKDDEFADAPQLLPGGKAILFTLAKGMSPDRWDRAQIVVQMLKTGDRKMLIEGGSDARYLPTGHLVYARGGVLFAVPFDLARLETIGEPVQIVEGVRRASGGNLGTTGNPLLTGAAQFSTSNTGTLMYVPGPVTVGTETADLALVDFDGNIQRLRLTPGNYVHARMSPKGQQIAFNSDDGNQSNVYILELGGGVPPQKRTIGGNNRFPIWTDDGKRIVFQSDVEGDHGIWWQAADGSGKAERLTKAEPDTAHVPESWSPKGDVLLYSITKGTRVTLWIFSTRDKTSQRFDDVESSNPLSSTFSPDGRWVAYDTEKTVVIQPFPSTGSKFELSGVSARPHHPVWSPDGAALFFEPQINQLSVVPVSTRAGTIVYGKPVSVLGGSFGSTNPGYARNRDIDHDGKRFITPVPVEQASSPETREIRVVLNWFEELKARVPVK